MIAEEMHAWMFVAAYLVSRCGDRSMRVLTIHALPLQQRQYFTSLMQLTVKVCTTRPLSIFHRRIVLSLLAPISNFSSEERSTYCTVLTEPVSLPLDAPDRISHSLTCLSTPPVKSTPEVIPAHTVYKANNHNNI